MNPKGGSSNADITPGFGDNVRIRSTPLTESLGVDGLTGSVYGWTTPSVTRVEVIGEVADDYALNVMLESGKEQRWFAPQLVEFVDHAAGTEIRIGTRSFVRTTSGEWRELQGPSPTLARRFIDRLLKSFRRS